MRRIVAIGTALCAFALPPGARAATPAACGSGTPTRAVSGAFATDLEGAYVLVPFEVPAGTTKVRVRICYDQPDAPTSAQIKHTLDLGLYEPATGAGIVGEAEFRGWGGSSRKDVFVSPSGATNGFLPGAIPPGTWTAEIGVAAVAGVDEGDTDGSVGWRLEMFVTDSPSDATPAWTAAPYDSTPAAAGPGWYKGDFHVHAEHSGSASMLSTFAYAFGARPTGAGLDFVTLSDYVTSRGWDEIGRWQAMFPGKLIVRSAEIITYRGHVNNHASARYVDYRTGPVYALGAHGATLVRAARAASALFDAIHAGGGWSQVNHPTTFPSKVPPFANLCRGCSWEYSDLETDWSKVDAMEVQTGPAGTPDPQGNELGPNPFTPLAIEWWDRLRRAGFDVTAVGSSDSHRAGSPQDVTQSPIGEATTVVYAPELSEAGIAHGIRAGHAYIKFFSSDGPDLRFEASAGGDRVIMGDELRAESAVLTATVLGAAPSPQPRMLVLLRDGVPILSAPVAADPFTLSVPATVPGDYRLQLQRGSAIEALTNPITLLAP